MWHTSHSPTHHIPSPPGGSRPPCCLLAWRTSLFPHWSPLSTCRHPWTGHIGAAGENGPDGPGWGSTSPSSVRSLTQPPSEGALAPPLPPHSNGGVGGDATSLPLLQCPAAGVGAADDFGLKAEIDEVIAQVQTAGGRARRPSPILPPVKPAINHEPRASSPPTTFVLQC